MALGSLMAEKRTSTGHRNATKELISIRGLLIVLHKGEEAASIWPWQQSAVTVDEWQPHVGVSLVWPAAE